MPRLVVDIDTDTHKALKRRALEEGTSISAIVRDLIEEKASVPKMKPRSGAAVRDFSKKAQSEGRMGR